MTQNQNSLTALTEHMLSAAKKAGADSADAIALRGTSLSIEVREHKLEHAERSEGVDIGLRVFIGDRQAIVSGSDIKPMTLELMAERAVAMAKEAPEDRYSGLADPDMFATDLDVSKLEMYDTASEPDPSELEAMAKEAESAAASIKGVTQVQASGSGYEERDVHIATSNGFSGGYRRTHTSLSCVAIAGEGVAMERDYDGDTRIFASDLRSAEEIGRSAGERAIQRLNPQKPKTGVYPVLFDERISSSLIGHLLGAVNGASVVRGSTWAKDLLGQQILPTELSLIEDPHRPRANGSRPFDGEGLPTQRRAIVENGILTGWTLDLASARKLNMAPTGNAARGISGPPSPASWNVALTQGSKSHQDMLRDMGTGFLVTSMIGSTINSTTGDYSRGAAGFWVENGELQYPVSGVTIAGNLIDMLKRLVPANDARAHLSTVVPSLLVDGMTLAGS